MDSHMQHFKVIMRECVICCTGHVGLAYPWHHLSSPSGTNKKAGYHFVDFEEKVRTHEENRR